MVDDATHTGEDGSLYSLIQGNALTDPEIKFYQFPGRPCGPAEWTPKTSHHSGQGGFPQSPYFQGHERHMLISVWTQIPC